MATYLLQEHYDVMAIRFLYPLTFGYKKSNSSEDAAMRSIHKLGESFSVCLLAISMWDPERILTHLLDRLPENDKGEHLSSMEKAHLWNHFSIAFQV